MCRYELLFTELQELTGDNGDGPNANHEEELVFPIELEAGDLGVAKWAQWSLEDLLTHLGFLGGRPVLFAGWRSQRGDQKYLEEIEEGDRAPVALMWHQAVGVATMSEGYWTEKPVKGGIPGMLLADNVGLGKTVEIMALIAMIIQTRSAEQQQRGVRANILGECGFHLSAPRAPRAPQWPAQHTAHLDASPQRSRSAALGSHLRCLT